MAQITTMAELPARETKSKEHPWEKWADRGKVVILTQGTDFRGKPGYYAKTAREKCEKLGLRAECQAGKKGGKEILYVLVKRAVAKATVRAERDEPPTLFEPSAR
jgi:hypothetical protein